MLVAAAGAWLSDVEVPAVSVDDEDLVVTAELPTDSTGDGDGVGPKKDEILQIGSTGCLTHTGRCCRYRSSERNLITECGEYGVGG